jgi:hypothetical protein
MVDSGFYGPAGELAGDIRGDIKNPAGELVTPRIDLGPIYASRLGT